MRDQRRRRKKKTTKKKSALDSILFTLIIVIAAIGLAVVGVFIGKGMAMVTHKEDSNQQQYAQKNTTAPTSEMDKEQEGDNDDSKDKTPVFNRDYVNVLVVGVDEGDLSEEAMINTRKADSLLLFNYYYNENIVNIISIPRDTVVGLNDEYFNLSESLEVGGIKTLLRATEDKLKSDINNYTIVDLDVFQEVVDSIGGVEVVIPYDMEYDDNLQDLHISFKKNEYRTLMGEDASKFIRWRMNNDGWSLPKNDVSRMEHLKTFIMGTIDKLKKTNFTMYGSIGQIIANNVTTDMDVMQLVRYVMGVKDIKQSNITYNTVLGAFTRGIDKDRFIFDMDSNREILRLLNGDGIKNIGRRDLNVKVVYDPAYKNSEELKKKIIALGYNEVELQEGTVDEESLYISEELVEFSQYILYDFDMGNFKIISPNDPKFDIILKIR